jgi:hypothetical protein
MSNTPIRHPYKTWGVKITHDDHVKDVAVKLGVTKYEHFIDADEFYYYSDSESGGKWQGRRLRPTRTVQSTDFLTDRYAVEGDELVDYGEVKDGKGSMLSFEQCLREEFLLNTQNYPKEYHKLFAEKFERAKRRFNEQ